MLIEGMQTIQPMLADPGTITALAAVIGAATSVAGAAGAFGGGASGAPDRGDPEVEEARRRAKARAARGVSARKTRLTGAETADPLVGRQTLLGGAGGAPGGPQPAAGGL